jgi:hypothetical protein
MATAKEVQSRLISSSAIKIRASLASSINAERIVAGYMDTHPVKSDNLAQDATRARAWCIAHVSYDFDALKLALKKHFANLYAFGLNDGAEKLNKALRSAVKAEKGTVVSAKVDHNVRTEIQLVFQTILLVDLFLCRKPFWILKTFKTIPSRQVFQR